MKLFNYANTIDRVLLNIRKMVPDWAGMQPGQKILDLCCGTGAQATLCAIHGMTAFGIDNNPVMLSQKMKLTEPVNSSRVELVTGDARKLPFEENCFDWACIQFGLHEKPLITRMAVISEMKRVVKPDGHFLFVDFNFPLPYNFTGLAIRLIERMAGKEHYGCFKDYLSREGLLPLLQSNGISAEKSASIKQRSITLIKAANDKRGFKIKTVL